MEQISLNYEASAGDTHKQTVSELPPEVVQCLENARFVRYMLRVLFNGCPSLTNLAVAHSSIWRLVSIISLTSP